MPRAADENLGGGQTGAVRLVCQARRTTRWLWSAARAGERMTSDKDALIGSHDIEVSGGALAGREQTEGALPAPDAEEARLGAQCLPGPAS